MLDRKKQLLNLPQNFPIDIKYLVDFMNAEIVWQKNETLLLIEDFSRIPKVFEEWMRDSPSQHAYWDISEGHLHRANSIRDIVNRLAYSYPAIGGRYYRPYLDPEVFAAYLRFNGHKKGIKFKEFMNNYVPHKPAVFYPL